MEQVVTNNASVTRTAWREVLAGWWPVVAGLLVLYIPTFFDLATGLWSGDQQGHGPIVLAVSCWFFYFKAKSIKQQHTPIVSSPATGLPVLIIGLALFVVGRSQSFLVFEVGSLIVVVLGITLFFFGRGVARHFWFAFFFMLFMVPLPGSVVDLVTQPMKLAVSVAATNILFWIGYPVARSGVVISIAQYQLLVADACAGLNSLFTLEALGLLYMNVMRHESIFRNATLAALIVPISFTANITRVIVLALITFYFGDHAGQGFLHDFSGMVLFITALLLIIGVDSLLRLLALKRKKGLRAIRQQTDRAPPMISAFRISLRQSVLFGGLLVITAIGAVVAQPHLVSINNPPDLEKTIPREFGDWREVRSSFLQVGITTGNEPNTDQPYDQTVMRTYVNSQGQLVMLALAWGSKQRQEVKVHRPDLCYVAQGFNVHSLETVTFRNIATAGNPVIGKRMVVLNNQEGEAVSYWMRIGSIYSEDAVETRLHILKEGLAGRIPDGVLVRASQRIGNAEAAVRSWPVLENFLTELTKSLPQATRTLAVR